MVSGTVVITQCNFTNNKASVWGGAIIADVSSMSISNTTLVNNSAYGGGEAIGVYSGSVSIFDCSLTK